MRRSTIFLFSIAAVLVLSAGFAVGRLYNHLPAVAPKAVDHGRGWFPETLNLSPEQKKSMDSVWADVKQQMDRNAEKRHALDHDREAAIRALLSAEQLVQYDKIFADYHASRAELDKDREKLLHAANDKSRSLLTAEQQVKWDAMAKDMHDHDHRGPGGVGGGPGGGPGGPGGPGGRHNGPATHPTP